MSPQATTVTVPPQSAQPIKVRAKASYLNAIVERFSVPKGAEALVNPLPLRFTGSTVETGAQSKYKALLVWGNLPLQSEGTGEVTVDPVELRGFLELYGDSEVEVVFDPQGDITIASPTRQSTLYSISGEAPFRSSFPTLSPGVAKFVKQKKETSWAGELEAAALQAASAPASLLGVKTWTLEGGPEAIQVRVGSAEGKSKKVNSSVPVTPSVQGPEPVSTDVGEDFGTLINALDGKVQVLIGAKTPVVVIAGTVNYMVTPRKE